ncbi:GGDEF domain-containing protein [Aureimonas sp. AU20]|uniref:GGDEF domain-containing protein n=1 Tax=Aureimonas sp. AU20 TaxID=1349819 RepID=UPI00072298D0|nr:GGDEF domain-containing protein [Aureimonas sp. AU20]ALN75702.1 hypothetical protein M673_23435 [Aureimonas sp. AU20]
MDNATLHFTDALVNLACGLTCMSLWLNQRKDACLTYWGGGLLLYGLVNSLFPFAPSTPLWSSAGLSCLKAADILLWAGFRLFDGKRPINRRLTTLPLVPISTCFVVGELTGDWALGERGALLAYCAIAFAQVVYVFRRRLGVFGPRSISAYAVTLNVAAVLAVSLFQGIWFTAVVGDSLFLLTDHVVTIVFTLAVIAMLGERDYRTVLRTAHRDLLTGVLNRSGLADAMTKGANVRSLLLVDLDNFKLVNDRFGHDGGDEVLRDFAGRMTRAVAADDLVVRLGGEEFLIASSRPSLGEATALADTIRRAAKERPSVVGGKLIAFTTSVGVAMRVGQEDLDCAIKRADMALYRAKEEGRDRVIDDNFGKPGRKDDRKDANVIRLQTLVRAKPVA